MEKNENIVTNANKSGHEKRNVPTLRFRGFTDNWALTPIKKLLKFQNGINADSNKYGKGVKYISVSDILNNQYITYDCIKGLIDIDEKTFNKFIVEYGDILFQRSSETFEDIGRANVYLDKEHPATFGGFVIRGKKISDYDPLFFRYLLCTYNARKQTIRMGAGAQHYNIGQEGLERISLYFPSIIEQEKISLFLNLLDDKIEVQNKIISKYETLIKGLCDRVFRHNKSIRLSDLVKCRTSTLQENDIVKYCDGEYKVFGASGVIATVDKYQFDGNGILVLKDGSNAGKVQFASGKYSVIGTSVVLIPNDVNDAKFLYFALLAVDFDKYKVGSGIPHIYFKDYSNEQIYYPAATLRERIIKTLNCYETKVEIEKEMLSALQKQKTFLLQSMFI